MPVDNPQALAISGFRILRNIGCLMRLKRFFCLLFFSMSVINAQTVVDSLTTGNTFEKTKSDSTETESVSVLPIIALYESMALAYGYLSTYSWGAYFIGTSYLIGSGILAGTLLFSSASEGIWYYLPPAIGFAVLGYYNIENYGRHSGEKKFWTNVIGLNTIMIGSLAIAYLAEKSSLKINLGPNSVHIVYNF